MGETVFKSECCGSCLFCRKEGSVWRCLKRKIGQLVVDAFHVCPLWRWK